MVVYIACTDEVQVLIHSVAVSHQNPFSTYATYEVKLNDLSLWWAFTWRTFARADYSSAWPILHEGRCTV